MIAADEREVEPTGALECWSRDQCHSRRESPWTTTECWPSWTRRIWGALPRARQPCRRSSRLHRRHRPRRRERALAAFVSGRSRRRARDTPHELLRRNGPQPVASAGDGRRRHRENSLTDGGAEAPWSPRGSITDRAVLRPPSARARPRVGPDRGRRDRRAASCQRATRGHPRPNPRGTPEGHPRACRKGLVAILAVTGDRQCGHSGRWTSVTWLKPSTRVIRNGSLPAFHIVAPVILTRLSFAAMRRINSRSWAA